MKMREPQALDAKEFKQGRQDAAFMALQIEHVRNAQGRPVLHTIVAPASCRRRANSQQTPMRWECS